MQFPPTPAPSVGASPSTSLGINCTRDPRCSDLKMAQPLQGFAISDRAAGLRPPGPDPLAAAAQEAADRAIAEADALLWVLDATAPIPREVADRAAALERPSAWVLNKMDLLGGAEPAGPPFADNKLIFRVSALTGAGVRELSDSLPGLLGLLRPPPRVVPQAPSPASRPTCAVPPSSFRLHPSAFSLPCLFTVNQRDTLAAARLALPDLNQARTRLTEMLGT
jgi:hypothetical protein